MAEAVAFDESGNTGPHLLDDAQPVFVLASCHLGEDVAQSTLTTLGSGADELSFSAVRRSVRRQADLVRMLDLPVLGGRVRLTGVHKRFMLTSKIVDLLLEMPLRRVGADIYIDSAHLAMSEVLFASQIVHPDRPWNPFLAAFQTLVRSPGETLAWEFLTILRVLTEDTTLGPARDILAMIPTTEREILTELESGEDLQAGDALDPALPTLFEQLDAWSREIEPFDVVHDDSKIVARSRRFLERASDRGKPPTDYGYGKRTVRLPFRVKSIRLASSHETAAIQIADLLAGAAAYVLKANLAGQPDEFAQALTNTIAVTWLHHTIWPSGALEFE